MYDADRCSYCNPRVPKYEIREDSFLGHPLAEILKDGGPIHEFDEHFMLNAREAAILLAVLPVLREFPLLTLGEPRFTTVEGTLFVLLKIEGSIRGRQCQWLAVDCDAVRRPIQMGRQKIEAVVALEPDLRAWLMANPRSVRWRAQAAV